mmetsp:Transcript_17720/g.55042  ORF Transcript_17720/g.55042 Transcript_17720/m.55042 type:complete len:412 (+) Transcript_17720:162-1397(+)
MVSRAVSPHATGALRGRPSWMLEAALLPGQLNEQTSERARAAEEGVPLAGDRGRTAKALSRRGRPAALTAGGAWSRWQKARPRALRRGRAAGALTSAALGLGILARALGDVQRGERLRGRRVDAHGAVEVGLGGAHLHAHREALRHLGGVGPQVVEAHHALVVGQVAHQLGHAGAVLAVRLALVLFVVCAPLQRLEVLDVHLHVVRAVLLHSVLLANADGAVLERREDSCGHGVVLHRDGAAVVQPLGQQHARLDGHRRELLPRLEHVANGVNVRYVGLLAGRVDLAVLLHRLHAARLQAQLLGERLAPDRKHHRVVVRVGVEAHVQIVKRGFHLALLGLLKLGGHRAADELGAMVFHVLDDLLGHLLIEAAQEDGAHHDGDVQPERGEQPRRLQRDVASADDERLAWRGG